MRGCCAAASPLVIASATALFSLLIFSTSALALTVYLFVTSGFDSLPTLLLLIATPSFSILYTTAHSSTVFCARVAHGRIHVALQRMCRACILGVILFWIATITTDFALNHGIWDSSLRGAIEKSIIGASIAAFASSCAIFFIVHRDDNSFGDLHIKSHGRSPLPLWHDENESSVDQKFADMYRSPRFNYSRPALYLHPRPALSSTSLTSLGVRHYNKRGGVYLARDTSRSRRMSSYRGSRMTRPNLPSFPHFPVLAAKESSNNTTQQEEQAQPGCQEPRRQEIGTQKEPPSRQLTARYSIYPPAYNTQKSSNKVTPLTIPTQVALAVPSPTEKMAVVPRTPVMKPRTLHSLHSSSSRGSIGSVMLSRRSPPADLQTVDESEGLELSVAKQNPESAAALYYGDTESWTCVPSTSGSSPSRTTASPSQSTKELDMPMPLIVRKVQCRQVHPTPSREQLKHKTSIAGNLVRMHVVSAAPTEEEMQELCRVLDAESLKLDERLNSFALAAPAKAQAVR